MNEIRVCNRCVMDNKSDEYISFDEEGYCNYCINALNTLNERYFPNDVGEAKLNSLVLRLKEEGQGKKYDCLMGLSGGLDSSYLAYLGTKWGLRIFAVHIDDGFDTEVAKTNLEKLCKAANIELIVEKPNDNQFNDLTRSYILAEVPNIAIPQDNILSACLFKIAKKHGIRTFLSGGNFSLESVLQKGNTYAAFDVVNIKAIHRKFGTGKIDKLPLQSVFKKRVVYGCFYRTNTVKPLDYIDYNRERAINELRKFCGFEYYGSKHLENTLTKVIQLYWFFHKFDVDKRKSHLSSMIVSGQMSRDEALEELQKPPYNKVEMEADIEVVLKALKFSREKFDEIIHRKGKKHTDYRTSKIEKLIHHPLLNKIRKI